MTVKTSGSSGGFFVATIFSKIFSEENPELGLLLVDGQPRFRSASGNTVPIYCGSHVLNIQYENGQGRP